MICTEIKPRSCWHGDICCRSFNIIFITPFSYYLTLPAVHLQESTLKELTQVAPSVKEMSRKSTQVNEATPTATLGTTAKSKLGVAESVGQGDPEAEEKSKLEKESEYQDESNSLSDKETGFGEHHHLHLSSCHECLQLENSTIESVRFASAEDIPELSDHCNSKLDENGGDCLATGIKRVNLAGKPPNVLIYVGSETAKVEFDQVKSVLLECIDADNYTIYQLHEEQVLKDPWIDNALLLIIATEEPISDKNQEQFVKFLSKGGKILGFSSSFTFGGIQIKRKDKLKKTVHELVVSKTDSTEVKLNLLISGCIFEVKKESNSKVKPLSHLNNADKDTVIVHLPYGDNGGEAILSQVLCMQKHRFAHCYTMLWYAKKIHWFLLLALWDAFKGQVWMDILVIVQGL